MIISQKQKYSKHIIQEYIISGYKNKTIHATSRSSNKMSSQFYRQYPSIHSTNSKKKYILAVAYSTINIHIGNLNFYKIQTSNLLGIYVPKNKRKRFEYGRLVSHQPLYALSNAFGSFFLVKFIAFFSKKK